MALRSPGKAFQTEAVRKGNDLLGPGVFPHPWQSECELPAATTRGAVSCCFKKVWLGGDQMEEFHKAGDIPAPGGRIDLATPAV